MTIFEELGVRTIINAKGPSTRVSGGFLSAEVAAAMQSAGEHCVDMAELQAAASGILSAVTGAEAGIVTSGAAAGLLLGTAACVAGLDPAKMARLPDTSGLKNEVVMARSQRNSYDHAVRAAGVRIVDVGLPDRFAGAGVRDAEAWEFASAITDRTAAVLYVANRDSQPSLETIVRVAHEAGVPVLVDAAAQLPPASNLRDFISAGADLVCFSGGKAIGGPQGSGVLCGSRDLIMSALLQNLDLDIEWEQWNPPATLIDKHRLRGLPPHGIGRSCKIGKETIVGLLVALRGFVAESDAMRQARWRALLEDLQQRIGGAGEIREGHVPMLLIRAADARGAVLTLQNGTPQVQVDPSRIADGWIGVHPGCLSPEDLEPLARRVQEILT